ncbi:unnamed protein product [Miscanthus lutarioriparius]|uniref:BURP domain-containing protein n=1 Tax=Miscanthus lutarioriparius TaxID=422564 RepID=A0A811QI18_9POAL|nr:unnamed protein product [Miscanthus lutarioriparius]
MARLLHSAIIATFVLLAVGQCSNAVLTEAEVFWRTVLPDSPLPDPILKLLHPETSFANKPKDDTAAEAYSLTWLMWGLRSPSRPTKHSSPRPSKDDTVAEAYSLTRLMWGLRSPSRPTKDSSPMPPHVRDHSTDEYLAQGLFFREEALQVASAPFALLPRHVADSIPFSTSSLPSALARLGVARNSVQAANMEETLYMCGLPPKAGAPKQPYTVRAVHPVDGSSFVSCHDHNYPYTVYMCHNTPATRAYMVELEGAGSGLVVTVAVICHTDTSHWDAEHFSFKVLGTKPGAGPICHYLPYGHNVWVKKEANRSSS